MIATMARRPLNVLPFLVILALVGLALVVVDTTRSHMEDYLIDSGAVLTWIATAK